MQPAPIMPERPHITVYRSLNGSTPVPGLKAWVLIHTSFNNTMMFTAHGVVAHEEVPERNFGHPVIEVDAATPYEALGLLKQKASEPPQYQFPAQRHLDVIKVAIERKNVFTPVIDLTDQMIDERPDYGSLPAPVIVHEGIAAILTHDSLVPADLACELGGLTPEALKEISPAYQSDKETLYRLRDVLG